MKTRAWKTLLGALLSSAVLAGGCGSIPPTSIDVIGGQPFDSKDVLVLGRVIELEADGDTIDFGEPRSFNWILIGHTNVTAVHLTVGDSLEGRIPLRDDGTFFWHLKPGAYALIGMTHFRGPTYTTSYWGRRIRFFVTPGDSAIYVGSLVVGNGVPKVRNDYDAAYASLKLRIPNINARPIARLMTTSDQPKPAELPLP